MELGERDPGRAPESVTRRLPDGGRESDTRTGGHAGREASTAGWVPTDDVISEHPDRQVLVVGDTIVGLALTLLLRRAGYDPLLVSEPNRPVPSRIASLCPPAIGVLDAIGVGTAIREYGTAIESVSVRDSAPASEAPTVLSRETTPAETPVLVRRRRLRRALDAQRPADQRGGNRTVETLSQEDGGLAVEFEDGIREWFDVAVDASGCAASLHTGCDAPPFDVLGQYELPTETEATRHQLREHWRPEAFVQQLPAPNGPGSVLRVTAPQPDIETALDWDSWEGIRPAESGDAVSEHDGREEATVRQVGLSDAAVTREWWGSGRVACCGAAACPIAPASGFDVTFGIEDAIAFVTALTSSARPVPAVVDSYAAGRERRLTTLRRTVEAARSAHAYPIQRSVQSPLAAVGTFRAVTLGSFLGAPMASIQRDGFG